MVYDCQLSRDVFNMEDIDEIKEEIGQDIDESYFDVLFEDVRAVSYTHLDVYKRQTLRCIYTKCFSYYFIFSFVY